MFHVSSVTLDRINKTGTVTITFDGANILTVAFDEAARLPNSLDYCPVNVQKQCALPLAPRRNTMAG